MVIRMGKVFVLPEDREAKLPRTTGMKAKRLWRLINEECNSMSRAFHWRMLAEQTHDPEFQRIEKILPVNEDNDADMMDWVIRKMKLQLAWIRKWKTQHIKESIEAFRNG